MNFVKAYNRPFHSWRVRISTFVHTRIVPSCKLQIQNQHIQTLIQTVTMKINELQRLSSSLPKIQLIIFDFMCP